MFDPKQIKSDFPILQKQVHGKQLVYLDNAASSQKPQAVLDAITGYYTQHNANVHRGVHQLSDESTQAWELSRAVIADFFGASPEELIMVRNTTEALNGVAYGWALNTISKGDELVVTALDHHSNFVTWQHVAKQVGAKLRVVPVTDQGTISVSELESMVSAKTKLVAVPLVSNATGAVLPIADIRALCTKYKARLVVDAAQAAPHMPLDFRSIGADFMALSGHKMLGPMGAGVLLVRKELLEASEMQPWLFGGGMINSVTTTKTTFHDDISERFTAGTPDVASAVGLAAACTYLKKLGMKQVEQHDRHLVAYALEQLSALPEVKLIGPTKSREETLHRLGSVSFMYADIHAHDVAQVLDSQGVAVRSGHHCTQPLHDACKWQATVRVSFQVYNSKADIDALITALQKVNKVFSV